MQALALVGGVVIAGLIALGLYTYLTTTTLRAKSRKRRT